MPLLFSLAIHNALLEVQESLLPGEHLFAFLDDIYVLCQPHPHEPGIQLHAGKIRTWNKAGICPPRMEDLGPDVWNPEGIKIIEEFSRVRVQEETKLWEALGWVPDVQCAWQILLQCAGPRCHHFLRTVPPAQSATYANSHDVGMWTATETVLGRLPGSVEQKDMARCLATLPMRLGGLGLRSAIPDDLCASSFVGRGDLGSHDRRAGKRLHRRVGVCCRAVGSRRFSATTRLQLRAGARPPVALDAEPGEWQHGWQFHASSLLEHHFRETVLLARPCPDDQVPHLRSHSGPGSSDVLCGAPSQPEFVVEPHLFRALVMERLRLPLDITEARCECGCRLDFEGRHRGACPRSGRLRTRAVGPERSLARVCREAGASVRCNTKTWLSPLWMRGRLKCWPADFHCSTAHSWRLTSP